MTLSLRKKRQTIRPSILHWMQGSIRLSVGLGCAWGLSGFGYAADPAMKQAAPAGRAAVDTVATRGTQSSAKSLKRVVRATNKVIRAQNEFEEPAVEEPATTERAAVIPPPDPVASSTLVAEGPDALKRLRDRSAKARWDQLHQEWLKSRKNREAQAEPAEPQGPAAEVPADANNAADPFDAGAGTQDGQPGAGRNSDAGRRRELPVNPVLLQDPQQPRPSLPTDEELGRLLNQDAGGRLPPPVRDPAALPKITEILPNPLERTSPAGRPIPELEKRYVQLGSVGYTPRSFPEQVYAFEATNVWSNPLYFEDAPLERYGHALPPLIQPVASIAKFSAQIAFLPYQMTIKPPHSQIYPLGWYAPGECVPYRLYQPPLNAKAAAVQAATVLGLSYGLP